MNLEIHLFPNDLNVEINIPQNHQFYSAFIKRAQKEIGLRRIHSYLFKNKLISGNVLDSGAWIGDNSIPWAKITNSVIYAIDPSEENCNFIKLMKEVNNLPNIFVYQIALSSINTKVSTNDGIHHAKFNYGTDGSTVIDSFSIDSLKEMNMIKDLSCIHLDVEGMEYDVILGANKTITEYRPIISFEQHLELDDYHQLSDHIKGYGYNNYLINETLADCRHDCRNFISIPSEIKFDNYLLDISAYCNKKDLLLKME